MFEVQQSNNKLNIPKYHNCINKLDFFYLEHSAISLIVNI